MHCELCMGGFYCNDDEIPDPNDDEIPDPMKNKRKKKWRRILANRNY